MSHSPEGPPSYRQPKSPFCKVIATRYYDGPLAGFLAHRDWNHVCVFRLVEWDRERERRVFEIARVDGQTFEGVVALLFEERLPTWPVWVLQGGARERGEKLLDECFGRARPVATVIAQDLLTDIVRWEAADDAPASSHWAVSTPDDS